MTFPFFAHIDMGLVQDKDNFKVKLMKLSNGAVRINQDKPKLLHVTTMAIKSGCRYVDEQATLDKNNFSEAFLDI